MQYWLVLVIFARRCRWSILTFHCHIESRNCHQQFQEIQVAGFDGIHEWAEAISWTDVVDVKAKVEEKHQNLTSSIPSECACCAELSHIEIWNRNEMWVLLANLIIFCMPWLFPCQGIFGFLSFIPLIFLKFSHAPIGIICVYLLHHFLVFV